MYDKKAIHAFDLIGGPLDDNFSKFNYCSFKRPQSEVQSLCICMQVVSLKLLSNNANIGGVNVAL